MSETFEGDIIMRKVFMLEIKIKNNWMYADKFKSFTKAEAYANTFYDNRQWRIIEK